MDRVSKFLQKLDRETRIELEAVLGKIIRQDLSGLDVKKLKGVHRLFRVRIGSIRIIYAQSGSEITILTAERRSERTYKA